MSNLNKTRLSGIHGGYLPIVKDGHVAMGGEVYCTLQSHACGCDRIWSGVQTLLTVGPRLLLPPTNLVT